MVTLPDNRYFPLISASRDRHFIKNFIYYRPVRIAGFQPCLLMTRRVRLVHHRHFQPISASWDYPFKGKINLKKSASDLVELGLGPQPGLYGEGRRNPSRIHWVLPAGQRETDFYSFFVASKSINRCKTMYVDNEVLPYPLRKSELSKYRGWNRTVPEKLYRISICAIENVSTAVNWLEILIFS